MHATFFVVPSWNTETLNENIREANVSILDRAIIIISIHVHISIFQCQIPMLEGCGM